LFLIYYVYQAAKSDPAPAPETEDLSHLNNENENEEGDVVDDDYDASFSKMDFCFQSKQYLRLGKVNKHDSSIEWHVGNALWKLGKGRTKAAVYVGVLEGDEIVEG
jgi:hypothetical protein